jgi:hypothetical protein
MKPNSIDVTATLERSKSEIIARHMADENAERFNLSRREAAQSQVSNLSHP